jgi:hypothetical protein
MLCLEPPHPPLAMSSTQISGLLALKIKIKRALSETHNKVILMAKIEKLADRYQLKIVCRIRNRRDHPPTICMCRITSRQEVPSSEEVVMFSYKKYG